MSQVIQFFAYDFLKALHVKTAEISALEATAETLNPKTLKP